MLSRFAPFINFYFPSFLEGASLGMLIAKTPIGPSFSLLFTVVVYPQEQAELPSVQARINTNLTQLNDNGDAVKGHTHLPRTRLYGTHSTRVTRPRQTHFDRRVNKQTDTKPGQVKEQCRLLKQQRVASEAEWRAARDKLK